jgi:hypothetical protein
MSRAFAISFLIIIAIIIMSTPLLIIKVDDVDARLQTVKSRDLVIGFELERQILFYNGKYI